MNWFFPAFIQANSNDVRFMGVHDGLQVFMHNDITSSSVRISNMHDDLDKDDAFSTSTYLKFVPPQLDFKERYLLILINVINSMCSFIKNMRSTCIARSFLYLELFIYCIHQFSLGVILNVNDSFWVNHYIIFFIIIVLFMHFFFRYLGIPHLEKVMLVNTDSNKTIHMSSVSGNTLHFHSSFFQVRQSKLLICVKIEEFCTNGHFFEGQNNTTERKYHFRGSLSRTSRRSGIQ